MFEKDPDDVRVILTPLVSKSKRNGLVARRTMPAIGAVAAENGLIAGEGISDDLHRHGPFRLPLPCD